MENNQVTTGTIASGIVVAYFLIKYGHEIIKFIYSPVAIICDEFYGYPLIGIISFILYTGWLIYVAKKYYENPK